jgi:hypothetical protein
MFIRTSQLFDSLAPTGREVTVVATGIRATPRLEPAGTAIRFLRVPAGCRAVSGRTGTGFSMIWVD